MSSTELALFAVAKEALAEAVRVDEVKDVRDHAERIRLYGQQCNDRSIIADATQIILRAERRLGELLRSAHETGQLGIGRPSRSNVDEGEEAPDDEQQVEVPQRVTLKEAGISKKLSTRSQKFAAISETAFEAALVSARDKILAGGAIVVNPLKDLSTAEKRSRRAAREIELGAKQMALPEAKFGVILTDDEWDYETWSENGMDRSAANHYPTSSLDKLKERDVLSLAADDAVHWLWTTAPHLAQGIELMAHRGFTYKTCVIWEKEYAGGGHGMGRWFWINHEILLLGTRGNVPAPAPGTQWPSIIKAPVGEHSAKPDIFYELIEAYFPTLPKVELNARRARPGWVRWGYEAPEEDQADAGRRLTVVTENGVTDGETSPPAGADTGTSEGGIATHFMSELAREVQGDPLQQSLTAGETAPLTPAQIDDSSNPDPHEVADAQADIGRAIVVMFMANKVSASLLQRRLAIGYNRARNIVDALIPLGIATGGAKPSLPLVPLRLDVSDAIVRMGDAEKIGLATLADWVGRPGNVTFVKNSRRRQKLSNPDRQREAVAEANRRRGAQ